MKFKDYYQVMGVQRSATQQDIKRAYRRLARKYHPDVSHEPEAEERFKELGEAYEVLKDPEKRRAYDRLGSGWSAGQDFQPPPDWDGHFEFRGGGFTPGDTSGFSDFFETLFGRGPGPFAGGRPGFHARGRDLHAAVQIDLSDAYRGATRNISIESHGPGKDGRPEHRRRHLSVRIPKGVRQGQLIRLVGQGDSGIGGSDPGDLYLEVSFRPNRLYRVEGADVHLTLPIAPWEAALGAVIETPTPEGPIELRIPPGSDSGRRLRVRGRGIPAGRPGDLYVTLRVVVPPADSERARQLYQRMRDDLAFDPRAAMED